MGYQEAKFVPPINPSFQRVLAAKCNACAALLALCCASPQWIEFLALKVKLNIFSSLVSADAFLKGASQFLAGKRKYQHLFKRRLEGRVAPRAPRTLHGTRLA
jgi:hypothetical protein